jgi:hypothetical protein
MPPISPLNPKSPYRRPDGSAGQPGALTPTAAPSASVAAGAKASATKSAPPLAEVIDHLAADIQRLRIDFERFFSGALHLPPEELRQRVATQLRALRNLSGGTAVDRFRLGDLEARYNAYNELFNRRLRDREEGRRRAASPSPPLPAVRYDPAAGIVIGRSPVPEAIVALYEGLAAGGLTAGGGGGGGGREPGPRFDLATFGAYLERQAAAIREKTGCEEVQFRLAAEDGRIKLKARPLGSARA